MELNPSKAREKLEDKGIKVTTFTSQGKMPFKDEKIDIAVNELSNYDKFEMYRILKPGGYLVVDQLGSDNYKEIISKIETIVGSESELNIKYLEFD